jgi:hypothetical protein
MICKKLCKPYDFRMFEGKCRLRNTYLQRGIQRRCKVHFAKHTGDNLSVLCRMSNAQLLEKLLRNSSNSFY